MTALLQSLHAFRGAASRAQEVVEARLEATRLAEAQVRQSCRCPAASVLTSPTFTHSLWCRTRVGAATAWAPDPVTCPMAVVLRLCTVPPRVACINTITTAGTPTPLVMTMLTGAMAISHQPRRASLRSPPASIGTATAASLAQRHPAWVPRQAT
jgi:hypothetical protein